MTPEQLHTLKVDLEAFLHARGLEYPKIEITTQALMQHRDVIEIRVSSFVADSVPPEKAGTKRFFRDAIPRGASD